MSRADAFDAFYRESQARLLHQVYAFTGDAHAARGALAEAYVAAAQQWRKVTREPDKDAWVRERAFKLSPRFRRPARALGSGAGGGEDGNRRVLDALARLPAPARRMVVLRHVVGLDVEAAAREVGVSVDAAEASLVECDAALSAGGLDTSPSSLSRRLAALRSDLVAETANRAARLRREGNRRRRSHVLLAGLCSLALVIGAGALTTAQPADSGEAEASPPSDQASPTETVVSAPEPIRFSDEQLTPLFRVAELDRALRWRIARTFDDFDLNAPYHHCLTSVSSDPGAAHLWVRQMTAGVEPSIRATEALEVSRTTSAAAKSYDRLVQEFATCPRGSHEVSAYAALESVGQQASVVTLRHADRAGVHTERVGVAQTGTAVIAWIIRATDAHWIGTPRLVALLGYSVNDVCGISKGTCATAPYGSAPRAPPSARAARGFLTAVDLPVFAGIADPWVPTRPRPVGSNPAATDCDRADFNGSGASRVRARDFVIPTARLPALFGMTETRGTFGSVKAAQGFVDAVSRDVATCSKRQLTLRVRLSDEVKVRRGSGNTWEISVSASKRHHVTFRVALVRASRHVAQLTFTPSQRLDVAPTRFAKLAQRAADRLAQL